MMNLPNTKLEESSLRMNNLLEKNVGIVPIEVLDAWYEVLQSLRDGENEEQH